MSNLFTRIMQYVVNEFLVDTLANSRLFQRFVVKTNQKWQKGVEAGKQTLEEIKATQAAQQVTSKLNNKQAQLNTFTSTFFQNLKNEFSKLMKK